MRKRGNNNFVEKLQKARYAWILIKKTQTTENPTFLVLLLEVPKNLNTNIDLMRFTVLSRSAQGFSILNQWQFSCYFYCLFWQWYILSYNKLIHQVSKENKCIPSINLYTLSDKHVWLQTVIICSFY